MFNRKLLAVIAAVAFSAISAVVFKATIDSAEAAPRVVGWPCSDPSPNEKFWEVYHESTYRMKVQGGWLYTVWLPDVFDKPPTLTFVAVPCRFIPQPL